jgi:hypothetical protein
MVTRWRRYNAPRGERMSMDHAALARMLATPVSATAKAELPAFALATFLDNYRRKSGTEAVYGSGVDIDGGASLEEVVDAFRDLYGHVYSTPSSTPDAPRFRVLLPYAEPLHNVRDVERVTIAMQRRAPGKVDGGTKDASRLWFPGWAGAAHFLYVPLTGDLLDAVRVSRDESAREERERTARQLDRAIRAARYPQQARSGSYGERALARACAEIASATEGDRHRALAREAWSMGTLVAAGSLSRPDAYSALDAASRAVFPADREHERCRTLEQQLAEGEKHPRSL